MLPVSVTLSNEILSFRQSRNKMNIFRLLSQLRHYERILVEIVVFEIGWVTLSVQQLNSLCYLSRGVVCVILR